MQLNNLHIFTKVNRKISKSKVVSILSRASRRLLFQELLHRGVEEGATPFSRLLHFTLDMYLILLSVMQGSIKY